MLMKNHGQDHFDESESGGGWNVPAAITDTGCERNLNEDRYAVIESPSGLAWLVCDGMGGATGGELAAQLAIDGIRRELESVDARPCAAALKSSILEANRIIVLRRQNQAFSQMGTTIVGALFSEVEVALGHVGDSRAYLIRDGVIQQLTTDHTFVQQLVDKGEIEAKDALDHPQAHILTRAIGAEPGLEVDLHRYYIWKTAPGEPSDTLLLCSDGLYSHVSDEEIASITSKEPPKQACVQLVELAKKRGGYDNITVAIIPIGGQMKQEPPIGYDEQAIRRSLELRSRPVRRKSDGGLLKRLLFVIALSILACLLVVLGLAFFLSQ